MSMWKAMAMHRLKPTGFGICLSALLLVSACSEDPHAKAMKLYSEVLQKHPDDDAFAHPDFDKAIAALKATPATPDEKKSRAMKLVTQIEEARAASLRVASMKEAENKRQAMVTKNKAAINSQAPANLSSADGGLDLAALGSDDAEGPEVDLLKDSTDDGESKDGDPGDNAGKKDGKKEKEPLKLNEPTTGPNKRSVMSLYERVRSAQGDEAMIFQLQVPSKRNTQKRDTFLNLPPRDRDEALAEGKERTAEIPPVVGSTVIRYQEVDKKKAMLIIRSRSGDKAHFGVLRASKEGGSWGFHSIETFYRDVGGKDIVAETLEALKDEACDFGSGW
jgi:hypothetical protein